MSIKRVNTEPMTHAISTIAFPVPTTLVPLAAFSGRHGPGYLLR